MINVENNQECFVQLWLRLERTRQLLEGQYKRFCIRNILRSWFGLRANDDMMWEVCNMCRREGWEQLPSPHLGRHSLREVLRAIVAYKLGISNRRVNGKLIDRAYREAFKTTDLSD